MAIDYITSPERDFSAGIDARSAENQIDPGFVKDLLNADIVEKRARKRKGYQGYAGNIPVRATRMDYDNTNNQVLFTLDSAVSLDSNVNLESVRSSPLVIYGRSSVFTTGEGPFIDTDSLHYYSKFLIPLRKQFLAPSGTLLINGTEHGIGTTNMFIGAVESLSTSSRNYTAVLTDGITVDETSFDVEIDYTTYVDRNVFVYYADKEAVTGESYIATLVHSGSPISQTFNVSAGTHALSNFNIIPQLQVDNGADRTICKPDQFLVASNGDVSITISNDTGASQTYYLILSTSPITNTSNGNVPGSSTGTVVLSAVERPWIFPGIYLEQTPGGTKELVYPDSIDYDDTTSEVTLTFTNSSGVARNFIVFYDYGNLRSNQLAVEDVSVTVSGEDTRPQITIWGLDHNEIYGTQKSAREGWSNHIDSYRRSGEQRLVTGLGGNLFSAQTYSEIGTILGLPQLYPNVNSRTSTDITVGPAFWETGEVPARTRGYITTDNAGTNWVRVSAVEYDTGSGNTTFTLELPNKQILDSAGVPTSLTSVIASSGNLNDYLTVENMSWARHNGTFRIVGVADGIDEIFITCEVPNNSEDYDDDGVGGSAGIFTDQFSWLANSPYIPGDTLQSSLLTEDQVLTVRSSSGIYTVVDSLFDRMQIAGGVVFTGSRTSAVVPLRTSYPNASASTTNLVRGDMLSYTGIARQLRVLYINADQNRSIDISSDGELATVTMTSGDTSYLVEGRQILLLEAGVYTGVITVETITSDTEFTFTTTETDSVTGATLVGETAQIDEQLSWMDTSSDSTVFRVEARWVPLEAPDDSYDLTPSTYIRHFDSSSYSLQPFLKSTMVVDNMYFTNYEDEVYKLDGSNIYRAGIIPWQPGAFLTQETSGATIVTNLRSITWSGSPSSADRAAGRLTISSADVNTLPVGTSVRLQGSTQTYTVRDYAQNGSHYILLDRAIDSGVSTSAGTISEIGVYRYYYRLNAVDANDNIIASAVTGYQDHVVELTGNTAIQHKVVGLPAWDVYDYDRLEVQIYRTKINTQAPFYLITTLEMSFDNSVGYIQFRDSFTDSDLIELDVVNTALKGAELGTTWTDPLRARYVTSIGNKLILGNVRDYPQLDIQIVADATLSNANYDNASLLFRKDNADIATTTNMVDRVRYEWINGTTGTPSAITVGTDEFTVQGIAETVAAGDWIYLTYNTVATSGRDLTLSGWWQIASVTGAGPYDATINYTGVAAPASSPNRYVLATDPSDVPVLLGTDGNLGMVNGDSFDTFDIMRRMSIAINATMRQTDITVAGQEEFQPWLVARGGNDTPPAGRLLVRRPRADDTSVEVVPTFTTGSLFINSIRRASGDQVSASSRIYPSRILASYENYPEIFDNPTSILDSDSDSAVDINSADGQALTGILPFFGEAAFGAAQQSAILVAFKTNSIYLVDLNQKAQGLNPVQRIETEGLGCTYPRSIAVTKKGIMFANESGMYCLRRDQSIEYIGRYMERNWTEKVDLEAADLVHGHHYGVGRVYKLSVPISSTTSSNGYIEPSEAYIYNHTAESLGQNQMGAWSRYDNHPATGWANLANDAFFGATSGRVFSIRRAGSVDDYRDDSSGITFQLDTRANDFGNSGIRKVLDGAIIHYRSPVTSSTTELLYAVDLETEYFPTTPMRIVKPQSTTGLSDTISKDINTIRHDIGRRRGVYFQLRIANATLDESVEVAGIDYRVGGLKDKGITQAAQTDEE